jgi:3',5'-nucleoside bisphosphate phosphatase
MRADLHTHTARSDGVLSPSELVGQAKAAGLEYLAVTDHDSVAGIEEAAEAAAKVQMQLIAGVELSVKDGAGVDDHLLGFFVDHHAESLQAYLQKLQQDREAMAEQTIQALEAIGLHVSRERVKELATGAVVTRPHIARVMVEQGYVTSEQEAFDRYLGSGKPAAPRRPTPHISTAIDAIKAAGGVAGLAHPIFAQDADAHSRLENLPKRLDALKELGLHALECHYPDATPEVSQRLLDLAHQKGLIATGGTDYHGPGKAPFAPLGQVSVDEDVVEALRSTRPAPPESRT